MVHSFLVNFELFLKQKNEMDSSRKADEIEHEDEGCSRIFMSLYLSVFTQCGFIIHSVQTFYALHFSITMENADFVFALKGEEKNDARKMNE